MASLSNEKIWQILDEVKDPEIPVVSVVELGLIRTVGLEEDHAIVHMSPTFVGCPAIQVMRTEIEKRLLEAGVERVTVQMVFSPPWSSDWITPQGREKLKDFGLAPPPRRTGGTDSPVLETAICPYCESEKTELTNSFGPTLCRAIFVCHNCQQPFEAFKPL